MRAAEGRRYASSFHALKQPIILLVKVRDLIRFLEENGWYLARTRGSHRQFKHAEKSGTVTVAGNANIDVPPGTLNSVLKQAGLKQEKGLEK